MAAAFAFVLPPLLRKHDNAVEAESERFNVDIAKQRLQDLKEQRAAGAITGDEYEDLYRELETVLADDLQADTTIDRPRVSGRWLIFVVLFAIPLVSVTLYRTLGNPEALLTESARMESQLDQINAMVDGLAKRLQNEPNDAQGWLMLGRSYKYMGRYAESADAFAEVYRLLGDEPEVLLQYADALGMANEGRLAGKPAELIAKALVKAPDDPTALWLSGMAEAEAGKYREALQHWQKLSEQLPKNSEPYHEVQALIVQASARLGIEPPASPTETPISRALRVNVALAGELSSAVEPTDTVFIYAQALQGPPMPLAIVKKSASELPLTVELNDAQAMMPALRLSNFEQVKINARISKSGQAETQPGDLIGRVEGVSTADTESIDIVIDQRVE